MSSAQFQQIAPGDLVIDTNVRLDAAIDGDFVASIKDHGVLVPIVAVYGDEGAVHVRYGQRRTLAAVQAKIETVPVLIHPAGTTDEALRIVQQMAENDHRANLSENDRRTAYEQLSILGLSAAQIAKRTHRPKEEVEAAAAVTSSAAATQAVASGVLTLNQAQVLAEFEDQPETIEALTQAATEGHGFDHLAQRARDDRARALAKTEAEAALTKAGIPVVDRPGYDRTGPVRLSDLYPADRDTPLTEDEHQDCPGHAAYINHISRTADSDTMTARVGYVCTEPKGKHRQGSAYGGPPSATATTGGGMSEDQKAERREVIERNKQWDAAQVVRGQFIEAFATGKTAPKGVEAVLLAALIDGDTAAVAYEDRTATRKRASTATPRQALRRSAALLLAAWHAKTGRHTWRNPTERDRRYMNALITWGYDASEVERLLTKTAKK